MNMYTEKSFDQEIHEDIAPPPPSDKNKPIRGGWW